MWADVIVSTSQPGLNGTAIGCTTDFYQGHSVVSADATGALVYLYDGATVYGGKQNIYASRSTDHGAHWTTPAVISTLGEESTMPMIESTGRGDHRGRPAVDLCVALDRSRCALDDARHRVGCR